MNIDKEREAFERCFSVTFGDSIPSIDRGKVWIGWQARAALLPSVEDIDELIRSYTEGWNAPVNGNMMPSKLEQRRTIAKAIRNLLEEPK